ncbi:MAG TPA: hypothetical protein PLV68_13025 [Ilumatobacteraceae bacterium]|nr:hypothetical protein [Ilumatobacteraceae bacterium]
MPMRQECKHFESRTYANGDTVRKCNLDLAPDAPWRCPDPCPRFERRLADVAWVHGSLITPPSPPEPPGLDDGTAAAVLDEAEDWLNEVGRQVRAEIEAGQPLLPREGRFRNIFRRKK